MEHQKLTVWNSNSSNSLEELDQVKNLHCLYYKEIGQTGEDVKHLLKNENIILYILKNTSEVTGYAFVELYDKSAYGSWIGLKTDDLQKGNGIFLMKEIHKDLKSKKVELLKLTTRNRFKKALSLYIQNGFDIYGVSLGDDGDLMINLKLSII